MLAPDPALRSGRDHTHAADGGIGAKAIEERDEIAIQLHPGFEVCAVAHIERYERGGVQRPFGPDEQDAAVQERRRPSLDLSGDGPEGFGDTDPDRMEVPAHGVGDFVQVDVEPVADEAAAPNPGPGFFRDTVSRSESISRHRTVGQIRRGATSLCSGQLVG
jgi:hypothetical protein